MNGEVLQITDYLPYGKERLTQQNSDYKNKYRFGGKEKDSESDLQYFEARYYNNGLGRFVSQDPVFWEVGQTKRGLKMLENPQGFNSYSFGLNNPIRFTDPSGQVAFDINDLNPFYIGQADAPGIQQSSMCSVKTNSNETWNNNSEYLGMIFNPLKGVLKKGTEEILEKGVANVVKQEVKAVVKKEARGSIGKDALNDAQTKNLKAFMKKIPANSKDSIKIYMGLDLTPPTKVTILTACNIQKIG